MALLNFGSKDTAGVEINPQVESFLKDYSIEVMPRTAEKIEDFRELLPAATRVYIAHIEGTPLKIWWPLPSASRAKALPLCRISPQGSSKMRPHCAIGSPCIRAKRALNKPCSSRAV